MIQPEPDVLVVNAMPEDVEIVVEPIECGNLVVPPVQVSQPVVSGSNIPCVPPSV